jgi:hypothetical protein
MLECMAKAIHTGVLREVVKDQAAAGEHWVPVPALLRRLRLDEPLEELRTRIRDAQAALQRGDAEWAVIELDFAEVLLRPMLSAEK